MTDKKQSLHDLFTTESHTKSDISDSSEVHSSEREEQRFKPVLNVSFDTTQNIDTSAIFNALNKRFPGQFTLINEPFQETISGKLNFRERINFGNQGLALISLDADKKGAFKSAYSNIPFDEVTYYLQEALPKEARIELFNQLNIQPLSPEDMKTIGNRLDGKVQRNKELDKLIEESSKNPPQSDLILAGDVKKALGVAQREAIFVRAGDQLNGEDITHIGTDGVGPCIAVIIHQPGNADHPPAAATLHIDSMTNIDVSLNPMLDQFPDKDNLRIDLKTSQYDPPTMRKLVDYFDQRNLKISSIDLNSSSSYLVDVQTGQIDTNSSIQATVLDYGNDYTQRLKLFNLQGTIPGNVTRPHDDDITRYDNTGSAPTLSIKP